MERKMRRIFGKGVEVKHMFFQGFKIGCCVGGIFGGLMGCYYAAVYRTFTYIPMGALGSGVSFGFFMGIGMVMRTEMDEARPAEDWLYQVDTVSFEAGQFKRESMPPFERFSVKQI